MTDPDTRILSKRERLFFFRPVQVKLLIFLSSSSPLVLVLFQYKESSGICNKKERDAKVRRKKE